jgi:hypothetical protein
MDEIVSLLIGLIIGLVIYMFYRTLTQKIHGPNSKDIVNKIYNYENKKYVLVAKPCLKILL